MKKSYLQLQPDAFTRFRTISFLLESMAKNKDPKKRYSILDIGGSSIFMYDFLSESSLDFELTIIDPRPKPVGINGKIKYIQSTGEEAAHLGRKFDFTIMIDMLEHVAGDTNKKSVLDSAIQLTTEAVIVAGPYEDYQTDKFEHSLNTINKELFGVDQDWLLEHFQCKKPDLNKVLSIFEKAGLHTKSVATLPFNFWLAAAFANLTPASSEFAKRATLAALNSKFNTEFENNPSLFFSDQGYRKIIIASKNKIPTLDAFSSNQDRYLDYEMHYTCLLSTLIISQTKEIFKTSQMLKTLDHEKGITDQRYVFLKDENTYLKERNFELENHILNYRAALKRIPLSKPAANLLRKIRK